MRQALGKGLDALIPGAAKADQLESQKGGLVMLPLGRVKPNPKQPRTQFDPAALAELTESIKEHGIAQPVVVAPLPSGDYELVAGERRWRAAQAAGLQTIPAILRDSLDEKSKLALALTENIQREDLNAIEAARAYRRLVSDFSLTQADLSRLVSKSRPAVANALRLLELPDEVQKEILRGRLTEGHGRALLMVEDQASRRALCDKAILHNLSVRELEKAARAAKTNKTNKSREPRSTIEVKNLESELQRRLGTKVRVSCSAKGVGTLSIEFFSFEDLERIVGLIKK